MAGVDLLAAPNLVVVGAPSWVNGRGDLLGSRTRLDSVQATGYFTWQPGDAEATGLSIDGQLGFGGNVYSQERRIDFLRTTASASSGGQQYLGKLRVSYTLPLSGTASVTPFAGVRAERWLCPPHVGNRLGPACPASEERLAPIRAFLPSSGTAAAFRRREWLRPIARGGKSARD